MKNGEAFHTVVKRKTVMERTDRAEWRIVENREGGAADGGA